MSQDLGAIAPTPGQGKAWAKGLKAATDARVARSAQGHRGLQYYRRTPPELCRWRGRRATIEPGWSARTAYVVGLIATDGCLVQRPRRIDFGSSDRQLAETFTALIGTPGRFRSAKTREGNIHNRVQFKHAEFYRWLLTIGLTPRKSLTLGALDVPELFFAPLVRGLLDGDGSITNHVWRADMTERPHSNYFWEWLNARFASASIRHLEWLRERLHCTPGLIGGSIQTTLKEDGRRCHQLKFGKYDSIRLLSWLYADPAAPCLERKRAIWINYRLRHGL